MSCPEVHPRVAAMIESGELVLSQGIEAHEITFHEWTGAGPRPGSHPIERGQLIIPLCMLRERPTPDAELAALVDAMVAPVTPEQAALVPDVLYAHCGRRCAVCDERFPLRIPYPARGRVCELRTPQQRLRQRWQGRAPVKDSSAARRCRRGAAVDNRGHAVHHQPRQNVPRPWWDQFESPARAQAGSTGHVLDHV